MFYEEKTDENGVVWCRSMPNGEWLVKVGAENTPQTDAELREIFRRMDPRAAQQIRADYYAATKALQTLATTLEVSDLELGSPFGAQLITWHFWACHARDAMKQSNLGRVL